MVAPADVGPGFQQNLDNGALILASKTKTGRMRLFYGTAAGIEFVLGFALLLLGRNAPLGSPAIPAALFLTGGLWLVLAAYSRERMPVRVRIGDSGFLLEYADRADVYVRWAAPGLQVIISHATREPPTEPADFPGRVLNTGGVVCPITVEIAESLIRRARVVGLNVAKVERSFRQGPSTLTRHLTKLSRP